MNQVTQQIPHLSRPLDDEQVVWFQNSGSFVLMNKIVQNIFRLYLEGQDAKTIGNFCIKNFPDIEVDALGFVAEIIERINKLNYEQNSIFNSTSVTQNINYAFIKHYHFETQHLSIYFQNQYVHDLIHPLFSSFETSNNQHPEPNSLKLISNSTFLQLTFNNVIIDTFNPNEFDHFKGAILKFLYSFIHLKDNSSWMMTLHSSGNIINNEAILFLAASGCGKSTLAAFLHKQGYPIISDDFVAADTDGSVYQFPAAMSVKEGSVEFLSEFYPELPNSPISTATNNKNVKYLNNPNKSFHPGISRNIKAIVFTNYSPLQKNQCKLLSKKESLKLLLQETWVNPVTDNVELFFDWFEATQFYQMNYTHSEDVLKYLTHISKT